MKILHFFPAFSLCVLIACSGNSGEEQVKTQPVQDSNYLWAKVLDSGPWPKSYNFQMLTQGDSIWVFHSEGNWFSADGKSWTKSGLPNAIHNLGFLDYVQFKGAVYGLGHFEGNIERFSLRPTIYKTTDMMHWDSTTGSNLPPRFFYHPFVFKDKVWIIGGEDTARKYSDVWSSDDAVHWAKQRDSLPFGARNHERVVKFKGNLYLMGSDVWTSTDALNWTKLVDAILPGEEVTGYSVEVFDDKIFLLGCNRNGRFLSQVLYSDDGKTWKNLAAPWSPRGAMATTVFKNKVYMTGGKYGGTPDHTEFVYSNDHGVLSVAENNK